MPENDDLDWVKRTTNELNNLLLGIQESAHLLESGAVPDENSRGKYFEIIRSNVERAVVVTRQMQQRAVADAPIEEPSVDDTVGTAETATGRASTIRIANPNGPGELVLIVDDEDFVTLLAQRVLTDEGYRVIVARDGFKALDIYRELGSEIDLVILDFTMPVMDGSEVFNELRLLNPDVAVVLSSGFTEQDKLRWMLSKGLRGFVPKPYTQQKLLSQIRSVLDSVRDEGKS